MLKLIRLEWKKNNVGKYIRNVVIMSALICSRETSGECCVEITTVSTLTGWRCSSYSTVTWVLPSGLR